MTFGIAERVPTNVDNQYADGHSISHTSVERIGRFAPSSAGSK